MLQYYQVLKYLQRDVVGGSCEEGALVAVCVVHLRKSLLEDTAVESDTVKKMLCVACYIYILISKVFYFVHQYISPAQIEINTRQVNGSDAPAPTDDCR